MDTRSRFVVDEKLDVVFAGKAFDKFVLVLIHTPYQVIRYTRVKRTRFREAVMM